MIELHYRLGPVPDDLLGPVPDDFLGPVPDVDSTASLKALDGRNRITVFALILICSPVCGLRPMRALR